MQNGAANDLRLLHLQEHILRFNVSSTCPHKGDTRWRRTEADTFSKIRLALGTQERRSLMRLVSVETSNDEQRASGKQRKFLGRSYRLLRLTEMTLFRFAANL